MEKFSHPKNPTKPLQTTTKENIKTFNCFLDPADRSIIEAAKIETCSTSLPGIEKNLYKTCF